jgi:uncharacterized protein (TIRG00374 family)
MLVLLASNVLGSLQWHLLLGSSGIQLSFSQSFRFYFVGLFFNNFLPANIGGDAVKIYDVSRVGSDVYQVTAVTVLDRLIGIFSLCLLAVVAAFWSQGSFGFYIAIFLGCMAPLIGFYFFRPLGRILRRVVAWARPLSMNRRASLILDHLSKFKAKRRFVLRLVLLSLLIQFARVLTHVLVAIALGVTIDPTVFRLFFVFVPLLSLAMIPPITVNGLGIREGLGILLFSQVGIGRTDAFAIEFLTYLVSVSISLIGILFFLSRRSARIGPRANVTTI